MDHWLNPVKMCKAEFGPNISTDRNDFQCGPPKYTFTGAAPRAGDDRTGIERVDPEAGDDVDFETWRASAATWIQIDGTPCGERHGFAKPKHYELFPRR